MRTVRVQVHNDILEQSTLLGADHPHSLAKSDASRCRAGQVVMVAVVCRGSNGQCREHEAVARWIRLDWT